MNECQSNDIFMEQYFTHNCKLTMHKGQSYIDCKSCISLTGLGYPKLINRFRFIFSGLSTNEISSSPTFSSGNINPSFVPNVDREKTSVWGRFHHGRENSIQTPVIGHIIHLKYLWRSTQHYKSARDLISFHNLPTTVLKARRVDVLFLEEYSEIK